MRARLFTAAFFGGFAVTLLVTLFMAVDAVVESGSIGRGGVGLVFVVALFISAFHAMFFGVPLMWLLARRGAMRWWAMAPGGALVGVLPSGVWMITRGYVPFSGAAWLLLPAGLGLAGALAALWAWQTLGQESPAPAQ